MKTIQILFVLFTVTFGFITCDLIGVLDSIPNIKDNRQKAYDYLLSLKTTNSSWGYETPRIITVLSLANEEWQIKDSTEVELSLKQQDTELLTELLKNDSKIGDPMRSGRLAMFVFGLLSTCQNPRNFYGFNLIDKLASMPTYHPYELGFVSLAICVSKTDLDQSKIMEMKTYLENKTAEVPMERDTLAMVVRALQCVSQQESSTGVEIVIARTLSQLKAVQNKTDGSFGNVYTSAEVAAALVHEDDESWNSKAAIDYFLKQQKSDGSFVDLAATEAILPSLFGKNYVDIRNTNCNRRSATSISSPDTAISSPDTASSSPATTPTLSISPSLISITYSIWEGESTIKKISINLNVARDVPFYQIMKVAAKIDSRYEFTAKDTAYGHYVQSINGLTEDVANKKYWILGTLAENAQEPEFLDRGVDNYFPKNGDHVVFWYKQMKW